MSAFNPKTLPPVKYVDWPVPVPNDWLRLSEGDVELLQAENHRFVLPDHEALRTVARPVTEEDIAGGALDRLYRRMHEAKRLGAVRRNIFGLAAPQVGASLRFIGVNLNYPNSPDGPLRWLINPVCEPLGEDTYLDSEGCFTCLKTGGDTPRYLRIRLFADNLKRPMEIVDQPNVKGHVVARGVQHETDHLNGILPVQRIVESGHNVRWIHAERRSSYLNYMRERRKDFSVPDSWPDIMPNEQWEHITSGDLPMPFDRVA